MLRRGTFNKGYKITLTSSKVFTLRALWVMLKTLAVLNACYIYWKNDLLQKYTNAKVD